jgi:hypothetical protein
VAGSSRIQKPTSVAKRGRECTIMACPQAKVPQTKVQDAQLPKRRFIGLEVSEEQPRIYGAIVPVWWSVHQQKVISFYTVECTSIDMFGYCTCAYSTEIK